MSYRKRFVEWCQRPSKIKIRTYTPRNFIVLITTLIILVSSGTVVGQRVLYSPPPFTAIPSESIATLTITTNTTLIKDYFNTTIIIGADDITLDGNGHWIIGPSPDYIYDPETWEF
ncbi:MAG: hypothetical protein JSV76_07645, partial [Candidatus Bathyarchaeota archaeon]